VDRVEAPWRNRQCFICLWYVRCLIESAERHSAFTENADEGAQHLRYPPGDLRHAHIARSRTTSSEAFLSRTVRANNPACRRMLWGIRQAWERCSDTIRSGGRRSDPAARRSVRARPEVGPAEPNGRGVSCGDFARSPQAAPATAVPTALSLALIAARPRLSGRSAS